MSEGPFISAMPICGAILGPPLIHRHCHRQGGPCRPCGAVSPGGRRSTWVAARMSRVWGAGSIEGINSCNGFSDLALRRLLSATASECLSLAASLTASVRSSCEDRPPPTRLSLAPLGPLAGRWGGLGAITCLGVRRSLWTQRRRPGDQAAQGLGGDPARQNSRQNLPGGQQIRMGAGKAAEGAGFGVHL